MYTDKELKEFGYDNAAFQYEYCNSPAVVGFEDEDVHIANPFTSDCGRFEVEPIKEYGIDNFNNWVSGAVARMDAMKVERQDLEDLGYRIYNLTEGGYIVADPHAGHDGFHVSADSLSGALYQAFQDFIVNND